MTFGFNTGPWHHVERPDLTPTAEPYPIDALPRVIREAIQCLWERHQVHPAICASIAHAALSIAMQARLMVRMPDGRLRPISTFYLILSPSGNAKSIPYDEFMLAHKERDAVVDALYETAKDEYPSRLSDWKKLRANLTKAIGNAQVKDEPHEHLVEKLEQLNRKKPAEPRPRNTLISDTTGAAFIERIAGKNQSVAIATDEAIVTFTYLYQYFGYANLAWGGSSFTVNRKGSGSNVIHDARISMLIMSQPEIFNDFCARHGDIAAGSGAWARYLIAFPPDVKDKVYPVDPASISLEPVQGLKTLIRDLISEQAHRIEAGITEPDIIVMDDDAAECFTAFANEMNERMKPGNNLDDVKDFASKAAEHAARLAATYAGLNKETKITLDLMAQAIRIIRYHLREFVDRFSMVTAAPGIVLDAEDIGNHLRRRYWSKNFVSVPLSHLERNGPWEELRNLERLIPALRYLEKQGKVYLHKEGRTTHVKYRALFGESAK